MWEEFLRAVEAEGRNDLKWFYEQWFGLTGAARKLSSLSR